MLGRSDIEFEHHINKYTLTFLDQKLELLYNESNSSGFIVLRRFYMIFTSFTLIFYISGFIQGFLAYPWEMFTHTFTGNLAIFSFCCIVSAFILEVLSNFIDAMNNFKGLFLPFALLVFIENLNNYSIQSGVFVFEDICSLFLIFLCTICNTIIWICPLISCFFGMTYFLVIMCLISPTITNAKGIGIAVFESVIIILIEGFLSYNIHKNFRKQFFQRQNEIRKKKKFKDILNKMCIPMCIINENRILFHNNALEGMLLINNSISLRDKRNQIKDKLLYIKAQITGENLLSKITFPLINEDQAEIYIK